MNPKTMLCKFIIIKVIIKLEVEKSQLAKKNIE